MISRILVPGISLCFNSALLRLPFYCLLVFSYKAIDISNSTYFLIMMFWQLHTQQHLKDKS